MCILSEMVVSNNMTNDNTSADEFEKKKNRLLKQENQKYKKSVFWGVQKHMVERIQLIT